MGENSECSLEDDGDGNQLPSYDPLLNFYTSGNSLGSVRIKTYLWGMTV